MRYPIKALNGKRTGMGLITSASHDNWALYIEFDNMCERHGSGGWLRVDLMREVKPLFGQEMVDAITKEAGRVLNG